MARKSPKKSRLSKRRASRRASKRHASKKRGSKRHGSRRGSKRRGSKGNVYSMVKKVMAIKVKEGISLQEAWDRVKMKKLFGAPPLVRGF